MVRSTKLFRKFTKLKYGSCITVITLGIEISFIYFTNACKLQQGGRDYNSSLAILIIGTSDESRISRCGGAKPLGGHDLR